LKGAESLPTRPPERPAGDQKTVARISIRFTEPDTPQNLDELKALLPKNESEPLFRTALNYAVKASSAAGRIPEEVCCIRVRDGMGCWWWCCGEWRNDCQDECSLIHCEVKKGEKASER